MDKILGMIGLAKRAGKTVTGEFLCEREIRSGRAKLIIIARDISDGARKKIIDACNHYGVKYVDFADAERLGRSTGADARMAVCVIDDNFSSAILSRIERIDE